MPVTKELTIVSSLPDQDVPEISFPDAVLPIAEKFGDKTYETDALTGRQETFVSVLDKSLRVASFLQKNGLGPGDRVAIHCGNVLEYTQVAFGIVRAGCTILNIRGETVRELRAIAEDAKPVYVFTETSNAAKVQEAVRDLDFCQGVVSFSEASGCVPLDKVLETDGSDFKKPIINPDEDVMLVTYSSGTTGLPKGVQLTHKNFVATILLRNYVAANNTRTLIYLNPVHLGGSLFRLTNLQSGFHGVLLPSFEVTSVLKAIEQYKVTQLVLMPTVALAIVNSAYNQYDLSSVETVTTGGGSVPRPVMEKLKNIFKFKNYIQGYGQTEAVGSFCPSNVPDSIGMIARNARAKVIDTETGKALPAGQIGELCVKGPTLMKGYLNNPDATKKAIDDQGWLHTGDLVYYDDQEKFHFVERIKEIMKCKDSQVSPFELEQILTSHPSVAEAVVIAVPHEEFGEVPRAYVVLKEPCDDDLVAYVDKQVADYKKLRGGLNVVESLPKSFIGKYLRRELQEKYMNELKKSNFA